MTAEASTQTIVYVDGQAPVHVNYKVLPDIVQKYSNWYSALLRLKLCRLSCLRYVLDRCEDLKGIVCRNHQVC